MKARSVEHKPLVAGVKHRTRRFDERHQEDTSRLGISGSRVGIESNRRPTETVKAVP